MAADVFVVGALHWDVVVDAPRLPALDETLMGNAVAYRFGGKGGNQAVAAARMGAQVAMAGCVGTDDFAPPVLAALAAAGVDATQVRQVSGATGMSVAIVEDAGDYGAVVISGVNRDIDPHHVDPGGARIVLLQNEIPEAINLATARKASGARIVLNAAPARPVSPEILALTDLLVVNRVEAAQMTGTQEADTALDILEGFGVGAIMLTQGPQGALLREAGETVRITPPQRSEGSAHGAGDAFVGALASDMARGASTAQAAVFAATAAACFVATPPADRAALTRPRIQVWAANI